MNKFSFCETVVASVNTFWHIRELTIHGKMLGGGADTKSLCGLEISWDLEVDINNFHLGKRTCLECYKKYLKFGEINEQV